MMAKDEEIAAVGTVISVPVLVFAIIVQKNMVKGMTMGAVK
jgi:multiple sugar transport system permease protein